MGQSGDLAKRLAQHIASGKLLPKDASSVRSAMVRGGKLAREIQEQMRINEHGGIIGGNLRNIRNPIGPNRAHLLQQYQQTEGCYSSVLQ